MAQNNKAQEESGSWKPFGQNRLDGITSRSARLLSTVQNGGNHVRIFGFFRDKIHTENLHF